MSQPDDTPTSTLPPSRSFDMPSLSGDPPAGPSIEKRTSRLDHVFNFQIVVFEVYFCIHTSYKETMTTSFQKVEDTLFQVLRNSFNVPGTPFEAMFALPQTETDNFEGSSLENPIYLSGIKAEHFRSFLRILYPLCVLMTLKFKYSRIYDKIPQHGPKACRRI